MSGHAGINAAAGAAAGATVLAVLFPIDLAKTFMQANGTSVPETAQKLLQSKTPFGRMYRGLTPALLEQFVNRGMLFGVGAMIKCRVPNGWPEPVRDAACGAGAAFIKTTVLHPLDSIKCRWQLGQPRFRNFGGLYRGLSPALVRSSFGMAIWLASRNHLERTLPCPTGSAAAAAAGWGAPMIASTHPLIVGALSSAVTDLCTFPFDTLKKGMQATGGASGGSGSERPSLIAEVRRLASEGGIARFYRGYTARFLMVTINGALFNVTFVAIKRMLSERIPGSKLMK